MIARLLNSLQIGGVITGDFGLAVAVRR